LLPDLLWRAAYTDSFAHPQVKPASMIWPYNLVLTTFLNTFHAEEDSTSGKMTRFKFFTIAFCGAFAWYFFPGEYHLSLLKVWWLTSTIACL
jgi:hypothetical protein